MSGCDAIVRQACKDSVAQAERLMQERHDWHCIWALAAMHLPQRSDVLCACAAVHAGQDAQRAAEPGVAGFE